VSVLPFHRVPRERRVPVSQRVERFRKHRRREVVEPFQEGLDRVVRGIDGGVQGDALRILFDDSDAHQPTDRPADLVLVIASDSLGSPDEDFVSTKDVIPHDDTLEHPGFVAQVRVDDDLRGPSGPLLGEGSGE